MKQVIWQTSLSRVRAPRAETRAETRAAWSRASSLSAPSSQGVAEEEDVEIILLDEDRDTRLLLRECGMVS